MIKRSQVAFVGALLIALALPAAPAQAGQIFTVNDAGDLQDYWADDGVCITDNLSCTLRAAIEQANATPGLDVIKFGFGSATTISPESELPPITDPVSILGVTGEEGYRLVRLDGGLMSSSRGLYLAPDSSGSYIMDLIIVNFPSTGIDVSSHNNVINGNLIGTDEEGSTGLGNTTGILVRSYETGNHIGHYDPDYVHPPGNVIAANGGDGISLVVGSETTIEGNYIGTNASGADLGNVGDGIRSYGATFTATNNTIKFNYRGIQAFYDQGTRSSVNLSVNNVSRNSYEGIALGGATGAITNNQITSNGGDGLHAQPDGGFDPLQSVSGNTFSRNGDRGIYFNTGSYVDMQNNVVTQNESHGVLLPGSGSSVFANGFIGTNAAGADKGNGGDGVIIHSLGSVTGSEVAFNDGDGVDVASTVPNAYATVFNSHIHHNTGDGVKVTGLATVMLGFFGGNSFHDNGGLAFDLNNEGVTANDPGDEDGGPNGLLNHPALSLATTDGSSVTINGAVDGPAPDEPGNISYYVNNSCDPSGYGEGKTYLDYEQVPGDGTFSHEIDETVTRGKYITATYSFMFETSSMESEFSNCVRVKGQPTTTSLKVTKTSTKVKGSGKISPVVGAVPVKLTLKRKSGGRFKVVKTKTVTASSTSLFATGFTRPRRGACRMTAAFAGTSVFEPSSKTVDFRC